MYQPLYSINTSALKVLVPNNPTESNSWKQYTLSSGTGITPWRSIYGNGGWLTVAQGPYQVFTSTGA